MGTRRLDVRVMRIYDPATERDGTRVLVDGLWPRGVRKDGLDIAEWCKAVAPSATLRKWYGHDPRRYTEFAHRYQAELRDRARAEALDHLRGLARRSTLTLVTATKDVERSHAAVLADVIRSSSSPR